ncbi:hypothetical protein BDV28DRAFT_3104 [Aspergillus coremiiformis]|uniref:Uncharacterized protein n=1 Tax=Aspergillus coremiiformis TaxID=138285 RepID=A0A5N6ZGW8_9EURO|nr:hypothetical protein BDV28DRAFT_3104 [Aspergillus coremiiformis]
MRCSLTLINRCSTGNSGFQYLLSANRERGYAAGLHPARAECLGKVAVQFLLFSFLASQRDEHPTASLAPH